MLEVARSDIVINISLICIVKLIYDYIKDTSNNCVFAKVKYIYL